MAEGLLTVSHGRMRFNPYEEMTNIKIEWELADVENIAEAQHQTGKAICLISSFQARVPVIDQMTLWRQRNVCALK